MTAPSLNALAADDLANGISASRRERSSGKVDSGDGDDDLASNFSPRQSQNSRTNDSIKSRSVETGQNEIRALPKTAIFRQLLIALTGPVASSGLAILILTILLPSANHVSGSAFDLLAMLVATRFGYQVFHPSRPVLKSPVMHRKVREVLADESLQILFFVASLYLVAQSVDRSTILLFAAVNLTGQTVLLQISRFLLKQFAKFSSGNTSFNFSRRAIIIGTGQRAREVADLVLDCPEMDTGLVGFLDYNSHRLWRYRDIPLIGHPDSLEYLASVSHIDAAILAVDLADMPRTESLFEVTERMGVPLCYMPDIYRGSIARATTGHLNGFPAIIYRAVPENKPALLAKRAFDRVGALIGIMLTAPIMMAAAIAIRLDSRGPILFRQIRSGLNGRTFEFLKFRTMCNEAEQQKADLGELNEMTGPVFKIRHDPRVTVVGRFLRRYSIDELPQLFNILRGQMSLVGPRPPLPSEVAKYEPWQRRKLSVKPGLTCLWQVNGRNRIDFDDWMKLDLEYIDNWSLWLDARILSRTLPAVIRGDGAS